jgi:DmsE family decaheme c-type cytochrome
MKQLQRLRVGLLHGFVVLLLAAFVLPGAAFAQASGDEEEYEDLALTGDNVCTRCHDDADDPNLMKIGRTKHGTRADGRTPTCTSCHGESRAHLDNPDGGDVRPLPDIIFAKHSQNSVEQRNASCVDCHKGGQQMHWAGSIHNARDVACVSCHTMHTDHDPVLTKKTQPQVCFECHKDKRAQISKPYRHPIEEGFMACSDCHNTHGTAGPKLMKRDTVVDTCYQCHMEKRGPFIWNHQPVTEDCTICHNPHGTTVARMLKVRPPFLCQQCHEQGHRTNLAEVGPAGTGGFGNRPNFTMGRACLNCHTNIHGGNNPTNNSASRSFRR